MTRGPGIGNMMSRMGANSDEQSSRTCLIVAVTVHLRECRGCRLKVRPQLASNHTEGILKGTTYVNFNKKRALELDKFTKRGLDQ